MNEDMKSNIIYSVALQQYSSSDCYLENIYHHHEIPAFFILLTDSEKFNNFNIIQCISAEGSLTIHRIISRPSTLMEHDSKALKKPVNKKSKFYNLFCWHWKSKTYCINYVDSSVEEKSFIKNNKKTDNISDSKIESGKIGNRKLDESNFNKQPKIIRRIFNHSNGSALKKKHFNQNENDYLKQPQRLKMDSQIEKENASLLYVAPKPSSKYLLGPVHFENRLKKCCVIDLDETLVHSSFKELIKYDFKISVEIEEDVHEIFIVKRPHVDTFLNKMSPLFECVLFTASLAKYANPVTELLDKNEVFRWRLFRESCIFFKGGFVKDLSMLGRPVDQIVIIDNSPISFMFHPQNAIHITSWYDDVNDRALLDLIPYLQKLSQSQTVPNFLRSEAPPSSAVYPIVMPSKFFNRPSYTGGLNQHVFESSFTNNLITSTDPNTLMKSSSSSSNPSMRKSMMDSLPSWRTLFSRSFNPSTSDRIILPIQNMNSKIFHNSKEYSFNTDEKESLNSIGPVVQSSSSRDAFNKSIKQNLNSALEIFSPRYRQFENRKLYLSKKSVRQKYQTDPNKHLIPKNEKYSNLRPILN